MYIPHTQYTCTVIEHVTIIGGYVGLHFPTAFHMGECSGQGLITASRSSVCKLFTKGLAAVQQCMRICLDPNFGRQSPLNEGRVCSSNWRTHPLPEMYTLFANVIIDVSADLYTLAVHCSL